MYKQIIEKAYVLVVSTDRKGGEVRIYAPYSGNLTKKKKEALNERLNRYIRSKCINVIGCLGWQTKNIVITRPDKNDIDQREKYKEDGASGCLMPNSIFVCGELY